MTLQAALFKIIFVPAKPQKGFAHILLIIPVLILSGLIASAAVKTTTKFEGDNAMVLGEDSSGNSGSGKSENKAEEIKKEEQRKQEESQKEAVKAQEEAKRQNVNNSGRGTTKNIVKTENGKTETEFETPGGPKVKTKIEDDGTQKIEVEQGKLKIKYVIENGKVVLKAEDESGEEVEIEDEDLEELEQEIEDSGIKVATESGRIKFGGNQNAITNFPLSINPTTNELIVTTPAGEKIVTILPDQAIANLLATNIVNVIEASESAGTSTAASIELTVRDGKVVYEIDGKKKSRLFGFIPVDTKIKAFVSAETGNVVAKQESILSRVVDLLSP